MDRREFMDRLGGQIRCKKAVPFVAREIEDHIEDQKRDFMAAGMTETEAEAAAVMEMGDPVEIGVAMDRIHRPKMNWWMIAFIGILNIAGLWMQYAVKDLMPFPVIPVRNISYIIIGFLLMIGICYIDYTRIAYYAKEILLVYYVVFLGIMGLTSGYMINGVNYLRIWFFPSSIYVEPRMTVFLFIPLYCAVLYSFRGQGYGGMIKAILVSVPQFIFCGITGIIFLVPVLAVVLSAAVWKGYFHVPVKRTLAVIWSIIALLPVGVVGLIWNFGAEYQKMRLQVMFRPSSYVMEEGYQYHTIRKLIAGSKLVGAADSLKELSGQTVPSTSLALTYITAYFGVLAAVLIMGAIVYLIWKMTAMTFRQKNQLGLLMGTGCGAVLLVHVIWYILMNTGIIPPGYAYCPFITYGGTGVIFTDILLGIMLSIYRYQNVSIVRMPEKIFQRRKCQE